MIVLDCGRSMCNEQGGISHLDRALNAAIVLSYIALRQGDNVGFLAFSNRAERWVRPVRGAGAIQAIIRHTYDIEPRYEASDYSLMVEELRRRFRKRSLVVLLTHALDELHLGAISRHVRQLRTPVFPRMHPKLPISWQPPHDVSEHAWPSTATVHACVWSEAMPLPHAPPLQVGVMQVRVC